MSLVPPSGQVLRSDPTKFWIQAVREVGLAAGCVGVVLNV